MRRSDDGGRTWGPTTLVHEEGGTTPITIGNPCPVVDATTGTIWLTFCRNNDDVLVTSSTDDGRTWAAPRTITRDGQAARLELVRDRARRGHPARREDRMPAGWSSLATTARGSTASR